MRLGQRACLQDPGQAGSHFTGSRQAKKLLAAAWPWWAGPLARRLRPVERDGRRGGKNCPVNPSSLAQEWDSACISHSHIVPQSATLHPSTEVGQLPEDRLWHVEASRR